MATLEGGATCDRPGGARQVNVIAKVMEKRTTEEEVEVTLSARGRRKERT
jgi:hypothetical protein